MARDVVEVLKENEVEIAVPKEQQCCGIAVFAHGDVESARELARKNIDVMEKTGADYIITACGSCGESWQHGFRELLSEDPVYGPKADHWKGRTYDISTFLTKVIDYKKPEGLLEATVTYHDPCHLKKVMKVFTEPRDSPEGHSRCDRKRDGEARCLLRERRLLHNYPSRNFHGNHGPQDGRHKKDGGRDGDHRVSGLHDAIVGKPGEFGTGRRRDPLHIPFGQIVPRRGEEQKKVETAGLLKKAHGASSIDVRKSTPFPPSFTRLASGPF